MHVCVSFLLLCTVVQHVSTERFFIITKPNDSCPGKFTGEPCLTITQFVSGSYTRFLSDPSRVTEITLDLLPGLHMVTNSYDFKVKDMVTFELRGAGTAGTILDCGSGEFNVSNVKDVHISGIEFVNCRKKIVINSVSEFMFENCSLSQGESLFIIDTSKAIVSRSSFTDSKETVYVRNTSVTINESTLTNNCVAIFGHDSCITVKESTFIMNIADCILDSSLFVRSGGAIHLEYTKLNQDFQDKALKIINSTFDGNKARENGGAIYISGVNMIVNGSTFVNNTARLQGGAVYIASTRASTESTSKIYESEFITNHARLGGGAVYAPASVQVNKSAFVSNTAHSRGGGAIYTGGHHSDIEVIRSIFRNNSAAYCGAFDVDELHHSIKFSRSIFTLNTATGKSDIGHILSFSGIKSDIGGVICVRNATIMIASCNFTQNVAAGYGGVMYVDDSRIMVEKSTFDGNTAGESGGVMFTELHQIQLVIKLSSFNNNRAQNGDGGVIYVGRAYSRVSISESSFGLNSATLRGGVIVIYGGVMDINTTKFHDNTAIFGGGIGSACNSEVAIPDIVVTSLDPEFSFCTLYEEHERQYDHVTTSTTMAVTTSIPLSTTNEATKTDTSHTGSMSTTTDSETITTQKVNSATTSTPTGTEMFDATTVAASTPTTAPSNAVITTTDPPVVYFELNGTIYLNNSAIALRDVGEDDNALACVTDNQECCGTPPNRMGEYYYPNGDEVPIHIRADNFYRRRGNRKIYLNRLSGITSPNGTYSCVIPDATGSFKTLYIDLV